MHSPETTSRPRVAVVLAAGRGTRMHSASTGPKCLLPLGQLAILDHVLASLPPWVEDISVVVPRDDHAISAHLAVRYASPDVRLHVVRNVEDDPAGTMSSLLASKPLIEQLLGHAGSDAFLCLNGDDVLDPGDLVRLSLVDPPAVLCHKGGGQARQPSSLIERRLPSLHPAYNTGAYKLTLGIFALPVRLSKRTGEQSLPATLEELPHLSGVLSTGWYPNNTPTEYKKTKAAMKPYLRETESAATSTADIDLADTKNAIELYRLCELGLFGEGGLGSQLAHEQIRRGIEAVQESVKRGGVVVMGAGTSGRLARLACNLIRSAVPNMADRIRSGLAGGLTGFVRTPPGEEDDPNRGVAELRRLAAGLSAPAVIGITCGMSAAYVGGALRTVLREGGFPILMGFNPPIDATDTKVGFGNWSMRSLAQQLDVYPDSLVIYPRLGPEAIAGSVRLKGGTATIVLLMQLLGGAVLRGFDHSEFLRQVRETINAAYEDRDGLCNLIEAIAKRLVKRDASKTHTSRCFYVGDGFCGLIAFMDANSCVTTFGSHHDDLRGVLLDGWDTILAPTDGGFTLPPEGVFRIDLDFWREQVLPTLTPSDLVIHVIHGPQPSKHLLSALCARGVQQATIVVSDNNDERTSLAAEPLIHLRIPHSSHLAIRGCLALLAVKILLNCASTLAHVKRGRTYRNRMIHLALVNNKVFERAVREIAYILDGSPEDAFEALLRAIYLQDDVTQLRERPMEEHVRHGASRRDAVPLALVLGTAKQQGTIAAAVAALSREPIIRKLLSPPRATHA